MSHRANVLRKAKRHPVAPQALISGKAEADLSEVAARIHNAGDKVKMQGSFPGGANLQNHHILPGELAIGYKDHHLNNARRGEPNEIGLTSFNGFDYARYPSYESAMDAYYAQGVVKSEYFFRDEDQNNTGYSQSNHGFSFQRGGSCTMLEHTGSMDIFAGDKVAWELPLTPNMLGAPLSSISPQASGYNGRPPGKYVATTVAYDPFDFRSHLAGIHVAMWFCEELNPWWRKGWSKLLVVSLLKSLQNNWVCGQPKKANKNRCE